MKSVAVFNNKGGVGKTTLLCNLAAYLAQPMDKRVLVVDCDPQCNTTQLIMGEDFATSFYWDDAKKNDFSTIANILQPIQDGDSTVDTSSVPIPRTRNRFSVDLIAGHPSLSFLEDKLSAAWGEVSAGEIGGYRKTNWARKLCNAHSDKYDIALFDVGPSLGALNRSVLLGCDNFITPMGTDIFSILGIRNISKWLGEAISTYEHGVMRCKELTPDGMTKYAIPAKPSIVNGFAGYTLNQYLTKSKGGKRIATSRYEDIIKKVPGIIEHLRDGYGVPGLGHAEIKLGDVPHLYSLIPLAQTRATPIIDLSGPDGIVGSQYQMVESYKKIISEIAHNFSRNIGLDAAP